MTTRQLAYQYLNECNFPDEHILREYLAQLEAEFGKLVRYVSLYGAYVRAWMKHVKEDAEYPDFHPVQVAWEALSDETRKAIEHDPQN